MDSLNKQNITGIHAASRGLRVQQPFRSPLRTPGTSKPESRVGGNLTRSPAIQSNNCRPSGLQSGSSSSDQCIQEETSTKEVSDSSKDNGERAGLGNTTPKRPVVNKRFSRVSTSHHSKASPHQFSIPFRSPVSNVNSAQQSLSKEDQLNQLLKYESELDGEITTLNNLGFKVEELKGHIENLHQYNETKDSAQLVMGRLAELDGVTVKEMHEKYGVTTLE